MSILLKHDYKNTKRSAVFGRLHVPLTLLSATTERTYRVGHKSDTSRTYITLYEVSPSLAHPVECTSSMQSLCI